MNATPVKIAGIIVNWNSSTDTIRLLRLLADTYPYVRPVVVDNASDPVDRLALEAVHAETWLLERRSHNGGYAAGVNAGLRISSELGCDWAWLINPDSLPFPRCLEKLLEYAEDAVALAPRQITSGAPFDLGSTYVSAAVTRRGRVRHIRCDGCARGAHDVDVVTGTGLLVNVPAAFEAGLLNESFFHYKEEFEFVERLGCLGGVRLVCSARFWHERGASLGHQSHDAAYYRTRNELLYVRTRHPKGWWFKLRTWRFTCRSLYSHRGQHSEVRRATLQGIRDGWRGVSGRRVSQ